MVIISWQSGINSIHPGPTVDYQPLPMTEELFLRRQQNLINAMLGAEDIEFRIIFFHKLQELMRRVP